METWLAAMLLGLIFSAMGWLLSNKDKKQEESINQLRNDIADLYRLHNQDAQNLLKLELDITKAQHSDPRFTSLEATFKEGLHELATSIREMMKDHMENYHKGGKQ